MCIKCSNPFCNMQWHSWHSYASFFLSQVKSFKRSEYYAFIMVLNGEKKIGDTFVFVYMGNDIVMLYYQLLLPLFLS